MTYQENIALISEIKDTISTWFSTANPDLYIWNGSEEETNPHFQLHCSPLRPVGEDYQSKRVDDNGAILIQGTREATITVAYLGSNAVDKINKVITLCHRPSTVDALYQSEIILVDLGEPQEETLPAGSSFEEKVSISLIIRTATAYLDYPDYYETTVVEGDVDSSSISLTLELPAAS